jgi:hypothetical protein
MEPLLNLYKNIKMNVIFNNPKKKNNYKLKNFFLKTPLVKISWQKKFPL